MDKFTYSIGRSKSNDIIIDDPSVSREHLISKVEKSGRIILEDLRSSNGTIVNGRKVKRTDLSDGDQLILGDYKVDTKKFIEELRSLYRKESNDYTIPFLSLMPEFTAYENEKRRIFNSGKNGAYIRVGLSLVILIILLVFPDIIPDKLRYPAILGIGILGSIFAINSQNAGKRKDQLDLLQAQYEDKLICPNPKCKAPLINRSLVAWKEVKKCRKCGARYFDE